MIVIYASVMIPHRYITAEVLALLERHFSNAREIFDTEKDLLLFESKDSTGSFPGLEELLVKRDIPFNRMTSQPEQERKFRPGKEDEDIIDVKVNYSNGLTTIGVQAIREALQLHSNDPWKAIETIKWELGRVDPVVSDLGDWARMEIPVRSTAEVEMERFSDIL